MFDSKQFSLLLKETRFLNKTTALYESARYVGEGRRNSAFLMVVQILNYRNFNIVIFPTAPFRYFCVSAPVIMNLNLLITKPKIYIAVQRAYYLKLLNRKLVPYTLNKSQKLNLKTYSQKLQFSPTQNFSAACCNFLVSSEPLNQEGSFLY